MAETVRFYLESMIPDLQDLEKRNFFNKEEIREIIKQRENYEYRLKRRVAKKIDFLRKERKKQLGIRTKNVPSEYSITKHIHDIFQRSLRKFKGDIRFWLQYIEFCKIFDSKKVLGRVFASLLQLYPSIPGLWILAASWEFENNANILTARALMLRGLRLCPESQLLWTEYFKLELIYLEKLNARRKILGLSVEKDTIEEGFIDIKSIGVEIETDNQEFQCKIQKISKENDDDFFKGAIPIAVFKMALKSLPETQEVYNSFVSISGLFPCLPFVLLSVRKYLAKKTKPCLQSSPELDFQSTETIFPDELDLTLSREPLDVDLIRSLFEKNQLQRDDITLRYIEFELSQGNLEKASHLYWKALPVVSDKEKFLVAYELMKQRLFLKEI